MAPIKDIIFLLLTGGLAAYLCWYFYQRYTPEQSTAQHLLSDGICSAFGFGTFAHLPRLGTFSPRPMC